MVLLALTNWWRVHFPVMEATFCLSTFMLTLVLIPDGKGEWGNFSQKSLLGEDLYSSSRGISMFFRLMGRTGRGGGGLTTS